MRSLLLTILLCLAGAAFSQDPVISLNIVIKDDDTGKKLPGAKVIVKTGGSVYVTKTSASNGKVPPIDLPLGQNYTVLITHDGYVTKVATVDGHYDYPEDLPPFIPFPIQTSLFQKVDGVDFNWLESTPMIKFELDQYGNQTWDQKYTSDMLKKIEDLKDELAKKKEEEAEKKEKFDELVADGDKANDKQEFETAVAKYEEALTLFDDAAVKKKLEDAKKAMEEAGKAKEIEEKYKNKMESAQKAYDDKQYEAALGLFKEASSIKPDESEPKDKIAEIEKLLADQKAQKEKFDKLVADGDAAVGKEAFDNAISNYEQALEIFDDPTVKTKLENAKKAKADKEAAEEAAKEQEEKYNNLITEADKLFGSEDYKDARSKYEEALKIKPDESHPSQQISKIDDILKKQQEEAEKNAKYDELIKTADEKFDSKSWDDAISKYEEALKLKPDEKHPKDQIALAKKNKDEESAEQELNEKYDKLMADGKGLMNGENFEDAIAKFKEASNLKSDEQEPKDLIKQCEERIKEKADAEALEAEYNKFMSEGKDAQSKDDLQGALGKYESALGVKPGDSEAQKKIDEVKKLIADNEAAQEQEAKFNELVEKGNKAFDSKSYQDAKSNYEEAIKIKDDQGVKDKIKEIDEILKKQAEEAENQQKYEETIKAADKLFDSKDWENAIDKYNEALSYKDDQYPKDKISEAQSNLAEEADAEEKEKQFNDLVAAGDQKAGEEKYTEAIKKYEEAIAIRPDPEVSKKIQDMKDKQKEAEENAETEAAYKAAIEKADGLRDAENYQDAIKAYEDALKIKSGESYPQEEIEKCKKIIKQKEEEEANKEAFEKKYKDLIAAADKAFDGEEYQKALKDYEEALTMKPNESHPKERVEEIKKIIAERDAAKEEQERYDAAIENADKFYNAENYKEAKSAYQEALNIKPKETYPDERIKLCDEKIAALENDQAEQEYQKVLSDAKKKLDAEDYKDAITLYEKAKDLRPSDPFPQDQIDKINKILEDLEKQQAIDEKYNAAIDKADGLFDAENYLEAKAAYEDAAEIKVNEQYPRDRIELCNERIKEKSVSEVEEQYQKIIQTAQEKMDSEDFDRALELFERAKNMKPTDPLPQRKIDEINEILKERAEQKELNERYQAAIDKADGLFDAENYKEAKTAYEEALDLKPLEQHPKDRIALCKEKMKENTVNEVEEQYQKILKTAQEKMDAEEYERALELFERAKDMKPSDPVPQKKIDEINEILKKLAEEKNTQDAYNLAVQKADELFKAENYKDAKKAYEDALEIIPSEQYPKDQIELCNQKMQDESVNEEEEQYQRLLEAAQKKFDEKNYDKALEYYERAKGIRPEDPLPQQRIDEINQILKEQADEEAKRKRFNELVGDADILFEKSKWSDAKKKYEAALDLYNEKYPRDQVDKCNENMKARPDELDAYRKLLAKADEYFDAENWDKAKNLYKRAVGLNRTDQYPKDQLKRIEEILNPPKEAITGSPELKDYGTPVNESGMDLEKMMQEAEEQAEYYELQQIYQQREDAQDSLREWSINNEDDVFDTKKKADEIEVDLSEQQWTGEQRRKETRDQVEVWREDIAETNTEYINLQENDVQYQNKKLDAIETEIVENSFDNDKPREQYEADIEKIKKENRDMINGEENKQIDEVYGSKTEIEEMVDEQASNDLSNDVDRLNTVVEVEDMQVVIINEHNKDVWHQEDETYRTKDEQNNIVEDILANDLESDSRREEFEEVVTEQKISYQERDAKNAQDQEDYNHDVKNETEKMRIDLEEDAFIANEKREGYEDIVEEKIVSYNERINNDANDQEDRNHDVKTETEKIREDLEEDALIANEKREGYEDIVEEKIVSYNERINNDANDQEDYNHDVKNETEKIRVDLEEDAFIANEKREGYEDIVEEKTVSYNKRINKDANDQEDYNHDVKNETEKIREDLEEDALIANEKREGYEDIVEEKIVSYNERINNDANDQEDRNHDVKTETEKIREDLEEDALIANEKREGYEDIVEEKIVSYNERINNDANDQEDRNFIVKGETEKIREDVEEDAIRANEEREDYVEVVDEKKVEIQNNISNNANDQEDITAKNDEYVEKMELDIQDHGQEMKDDQDKNADKNLDAIEEHIEHVNDHEYDNEQSRIEGENYVQELKDLKLQNFSPDMANELGKKFPEGVTETSFAINDSRGIMKAYIVRRIVVTDGVGVVYEMTKARHGAVSYTRNGEPIPEYVWSDETAGGTRN